MQFAAFLTAINDDIALFGIRHGADGAQNAAAGVCPIPGVDIDMQGAQAKRAMVPRGGQHGQYFPAAYGAAKALIVL